MTQKKSTPAHAADSAAPRRRAAAHTPQRTLPDEPAAPKKTSKTPAGPRDAAPAPAEQPETSAQRHFMLPRVTRWIVLILLLAFLGLVIWNYRASLTPANIKNWVQTYLLGYSDGTGYPVTLADGSVNFGNFSVEDSSPATVSNTTFLLLSKGGKTLSLRQHGYTTPVMKRWGKNFLIYDLGNKSFRVSRNGTDFTENTQYDYPIYTGAIAKNGSYAIASASEGYTSELRVFDRNGLPLLEWASQHYLISTVAFSPDGKSVAAAAFASEGGTLKTVIHVFNFNKDTPVASHTMEGCVMLDIIFNDNQTVTAVGDTAAFRFTLGENPYYYDYEGLSLSAFDLTTDGAVLALSPSSDGRSGSLVHLNESLDAHTVSRFDQTVDSIQLYNGNTAMLSDGLLTVFNDSGIAILTADAGVDAVRAICSEGVCYVLGTGEIRAVELNLPTED